MLSGKELIIDGPIYSMIGKERKVIYLGKLKKRQEEPKEYALHFERFSIIRNLEYKMFFIESPPDCCEEEVCCCFTTSEEGSIFQSVNNIHMWGTIYSEK